MSDSFRSVVENCIDFNNLKAELNNIHYSVIPANAESSQKRYLLEIKKRIVNVPSNLLNKYLFTDLQNQNVIEFFAVCNKYSIIREFMLEVIRNKWLNLDFELENYDFKTFLIIKLSYTENLEQLT